MVRDWLTDRIWAAREAIASRRGAAAAAAAAAAVAAVVVVVAVVVTVVVVSFHGPGGGETAPPTSVQLRPGEVPPVTLAATGACKAAVEKVQRFVDEHHAGELSTNDELAKSFADTMAEVAEVCPVRAQDALQFLYLNRWFLGDTGPPPSPPTTLATP